jgi:hypothetical protein
MLPLIFIRVAYCPPNTYEYSALTLPNPPNFYPYSLLYMGQPLQIMYAFIIHVSFQICVRNVFGSYLGRNTDYLDRSFSLFFSVAPGNVGIAPRLGHDCLLPRRFQFGNHQSFCYSMLCTRRCWQRRKTSQKKYLCVLYRNLILQHQEKGFFVA